MNKLSGRKYLIASGKTSLSRDKVEGYRRIFAEQGYELPEWKPEDSPRVQAREKPGVRPTREPVGTILARKFEWIAKSSSGCSSCNSLAAKMDRNGADWCEDNLEEITQGILANAKELNRQNLISRTVLGSSVGRELLKIIVGRFVRSAIAEARQKQKERKNG